MNTPRFRAGWLLGAALLLFLIPDRATAAETLEQTATRAYESGDCERAIPLLERLARTSSDRFQRSDAWFRWGYCHSDQELWEKARDGFREALRLDPEDEEAQFKLIEALVELGDFSAARRELRLVSRRGVQNASDLDYWKRQVQREQQQFFGFLSVAGFNDQSVASSNWLDQAGQLDVQLTWRWWKSGRARFLSTLRATGSFYRQTPTSNQQSLSLQNRWILAPNRNWEIELSLSLRDLRYNYLYYQDSILTGVQAERFLSRQWSVSAGLLYTQYVTTNLAWSLSPSITLNFDSSWIRIWAGGSVLQSQGSAARLSGSPLELTSGTLFGDSMAYSPYAGAEIRLPWNWKWDLSVYQTHTTYDKMTTASGSTISERQDQATGYSMTLSRPFGQSGWRGFLDFFSGKNAAGGASELPTTLFDPSVYNYTRRTTMLGVSRSF